MDLRLLVIDGADQGRVFPLAPEGTTLIGRPPDADITLNDLYVKRAHCRLEIAGDEVVVLDLTESGGTLVNGQPVGQQELHVGDVLRVGNSHLRLEEDDGSRPEEEEEHEAEEPAAEKKPRGLPLLPAERLHDLSGRSLGHFDIAEVLGRGHCGTVFRATDRRDGHEVALKVFPIDFPKSDAEMQRFARVLKELLPLRYQHLVVVLAAGKSGPYCWVAREYVAGKSAAQAAGRAGAGGKVNWKEALRIAAHVARALEFVHRRHGPHGNVTPANVLIRDEDKVVKLADLMLAEALEGSALYAARLEGKLLAELPYLAPEQIDPEAPVDALADLYGLGAVVYARLTGRPPFQGPTPEETLALIREAPLARPRQHHAYIPSDFEASVVRLLSRRPEDRYPTPRALLTDLEAIAAREGVTL